MNIPEQFFHNALPKKNNNNNTQIKEFSVKNNNLPIL